jgi:excisionase family DNA binding protein
MKIDLLTIDEVAAKLGCSKQQISKYLADGRIPHVALGGRKFIERRHARKPKPKKAGRKPA